MSQRANWQGMWTIMRFNWPFYLAAAVLLIATFSGAFWFATPLMKWLCGFGLAGAFYFLIGSLGVSHLVYDRSDLYRWAWLERALRGANRSRMIFCHSGFDETSQDLRERLCDAEWLMLDHYDEARMTEASIRRARKMFPPAKGTMAAAFDSWPVPADSADVVFGLLAIHELRSEAERIAWFSEANRCLKAGGRIVLAEHTRDLANFLAFGPGFLHFHSCASWRKCWEAAGMRTFDEFRVTPWIRIFLITKL